MAVTSRTVSLMNKRIGELQEQLNRIEAKLDVLVPPQNEAKRAKPKPKPRSLAKKTS